MSFAPRPSFEYLPHVGELGIRFRAVTSAEIFRQAALALADLLLPDSPPSGPVQVREIVLDAPDHAALLVDWLNELLFLAERDRWVPVQVDAVDATEQQLRAVVHGVVLEQAPTLVKAATWHGLRFDARDGGFEAEVLLDL